MTTCQDEENPASDQSHVEQVCHSEIDVEETVEDVDDEFHFANRKTHA